MINVSNYETNIRGNFSCWLVEHTYCAILRNMSWIIHRYILFCQALKYTRLFLYTVDYQHTLDREKV